MNKVLTPMIIEEIIKLSLENKSNKEIGNQFGVSATQIANVVNKKGIVLKTETNRRLVRQAVVTKLDIIEGMRSAITLAENLGDPAAMIKGWTEVAKLMGYYQTLPEIKALSANTTEADLKALTNSQLQEIIEGEYTYEKH